MSKTTKVLLIIDLILLVLFVFNVGHLFGADATIAPALAHVLKGQS